MAIIQEMGDTGRLCAQTPHRTLLIISIYDLTHSARRSNQLILKEMDPEYSLEGLLPKLQFFSHLM